MPVENAKTDATDVGGYSPPFIRHQIRTHAYYIGRMFPALKHITLAIAFSELETASQFCFCGSGHP